MQAVWNKVVSFFVYRRHSAISIGAPQPHTGFGIILTLKACKLLHSCLIQASVVLYLHSPILTNFMQLFCLV